MTGPEVHAIFNDSEGTFNVSLACCKEKKGIMVQDKVHAMREQLGSEDVATKPGVKRKASVTAGRPGPGLQQFVFVLFFTCTSALPHFYDCGCQI